LRTTELDKQTLNERYETYCSSQRTCWCFCYL